MLYNSGGSLGVLKSPDYIREGVRAVWRLQGAAPLGGQLVLCVVAHHLLCDLLISSPFCQGKKASEL